MEGSGRFSELWKCVKDLQEHGFNGLGEEVLGVLVDWEQDNQGEVTTGFWGHENMSVSGSASMVPYWCA